MIYVTRRHVKKVKCPSTFTGRSYVNYNEQLFIEQLLRSNWDEFYLTLDSNVAWSIIKNNILFHINRMCPIKSFRIKSLKDPWITNEILEQIKDKDILLKKAKRTNLSEDWKIARRRRNEVKTLVKHAKSNFIKDNLHEYKNDSKKFWNSLGDILPAKKSKKSNKITLKSNNGNLISQDKVAANTMNNFFTSIGPNLAKDFSDPWVYSGTVNDIYMNDITTDRLDVLKYVKEIDTSKSFLNLP